MVYICRSGQGWWFEGSGCFSAVRPGSPNNAAAPCRGPPRLRGAGRGLDGYKGIQSLGSNYQQWNLGHPIRGAFWRVARTVAVKHHVCEPPRARGEQRGAWPIPVCVCVFLYISCLEEDVDITCPTQSVDMKHE